MPAGDINNSYTYSAHPLLIITALLLTVIFIAAIIWGWYNQRLIIYTAGREIAKLGTSIQTANLPNIKGEQFTVKYYPGDEEQAQLVLDAAEKFMHPVSEKLEYNHKQRITIVVYPTREKLNRYFGWPADESAMGVYWAGTIRVLAPREWVNIQDQEKARQVFYTSGPMAHEIAHLVVDYRTRGNYTRWFTEGIAQYVELEITGFRFREEAGSLNQQRYSLQQLTYEYDELPNQSLAYRQSLAAIVYMVENYGQQSLHEVMDLLGKGYTTDQALIKVCNVNLDTFERQLNDWLDKNWRLLS